MNFRILQVFAFPLHAYRIYVGKIIICKPFSKNSISAIHAQKYFAYLLKYSPRIWLKNALIMCQCRQQVASSSSFGHCPPII